MKGFAKLIRTVYSSSKFLPSEYLPWENYLGQYNSSCISSVALKNYSKVAAIEELPQRLNDEGYEELLRALLTDRELLFSQARERYYSGLSHSKVNYKNGAVRQSRNLAHSLVDRREVMLNQILGYAETAYVRREASEPKFYPLMSFERVKFAIRRLFEDWDGPFSSFDLQNNNDDNAGYCQATLDNIEDPEQSETVMRTWLNNTYMKFGNTLIEVGSYSKDIGLKTEEAFEFFANILPSCICAEARVNRLKLDGAVYKPVIAKEQIEVFSYQISAFEEENFSKWKTALPVLGCYLYPNLDRFSAKHTISCSCASDDTDESYVQKLADAFSSYLTSMEPHPKSKRNETAKTIASYFAESRDEHSRPLFADNPISIFLLFRSPVHRVIHTMSPGKEMCQLISDAYKNPLPVTMQPLSEDELLFREIINVCAKICAVTHTPFESSHWCALWDCIRQSVQSLAFRIEDLFSVRHLFRNLLRFTRPNSEYRLLGYLVFDKWLEQKLYTAQPPAYISLWRTLVNKLSSPLQNHDDSLRQTIKTYQALFTDSYATDEHTVWKCLQPLCCCIGWNYVKSMPADEEIDWAAKTAEFIVEKPISKKLRNKIANEIKHSNMEGTQDVPALRAVHMEWLFVQCICDEARRKLMESVYLHLKKAAEDPV